MYLCYGVVFLLNKKIKCKYYVNNLYKCFFNTIKEYNGHNTKDGRC